MTTNDAENYDAENYDDEQPAAAEPVGNAGLPGPDDEIQVTGHVLGPGDGVDYKGPEQAQQDDSTDED